MDFLDFDLLSVADADASDGLRGRMRTLRRLIQRSMIDRGVRSQSRCFCQNSGACGSHYIVDLLSENGLEKVFHEKAPDFNELGVAHYDSPLPKTRLVRALRYTRHNVNFEANNRLFSLSLELAEAFENASFIHLFRHPASAVRSAMSKPNVEDYLKNDVRFQGSLAGSLGQNPLHRFCQYWHNMNRRILDDLTTLRSAGKQVMWLSFEDLIAGETSQLEQFIGCELSQKVRAPSHVGALRSDGKFESFEQWQPADKEMLEEICTPLHEQLVKLSRSSGTNSKSVGSSHS